MASNGQAAWGWDALCNAVTDKFDRLTSWVAERPGTVAVAAGVGVLAVCAAVALYKKNSQAEVKPAHSKIYTEPKSVPPVVLVDESSSGSTNQDAASTVDTTNLTAEPVSDAAIGVMPAAAVPMEMSNVAAAQVVAHPAVAATAAVRRLTQVAPKNITHRDGAQISVYGVSDSTTKSFTFGGSINVDLVITLAGKSGKIGAIHVSDDFELLVFTGKNFGAFPALCDIKGIELSDDNNLILIHRSTDRRYDTGIKLQLPHDVHVRLADSCNPTVVKTELKTATCSCCHKAVAFESMKKCSKCKQAVYCSLECQKEDWKADGGNHKATCQSVAV